MGCVAVCMVFAYMANSNERTPRIRPLVTKQTTALRPPAYDHWNFFSYLSVRTPSTKPFGWGYSSEVSRVEV
ncbi:MAG: hypothetical protein GTO30_18785, partial [Acidobacteria bacterium]|nr:hypothetical protein [Acidobacteriota bacterium]NIM63611.1 hypothetical protein [Acidobacteriota bacterium]NIT10891.1 hypothetical protein [Acidobacteriota bacterium]